MFDGPGYGFGIWHALQSAFMAIGGFLLLIIFLGLVAVLVRFLLVATKAAELYVAQNGSKSTASDVVAAPPTPAPAEPVGPVGASETPPKPAPRPRTPKAPPAP
jgi:cell division septation protein DedD